MYKIVICDDDIVFCEYLKNYIQNTIKLNLKIDIFVNPFELIDCITEYDVIFLDYAMPYMNGIDFLDKIKDIGIIKVMISNYNHISFDTYEYKLFWFIRKDCLEYDISRMMPNLHNELIDSAKKFKIITHSKCLSIFYKDIMYIETTSNNLLIWTKNEVFKIRATFNSIVPYFENMGFIIPICGVIVNIDFIKYINFNKAIVVLINGKDFTISRSKKGSVRKTYEGYVVNF